MKIRTCLIGSYLLLILLLTGGMWIIGDRLSRELTTQNLSAAEKGAQRTIDANYKIAEQVLTTYGQFLVDSRVEGMARALAFRLKGRDLSNYAVLRQDQALRDMATREIKTPEGSVGFMNVYDNKGEVLFHHLQRVEGKNIFEWQKDHADLHQLIQRSLVEERVAGYYHYTDRVKGERKRYTARVHVNGTPFIVAANVNVDEFFEPAQERIKQAGREIMVESKKRIRANATNMARQVKSMILGGGAVFSLIGVCAGLLFAAAIARPILHLRDGVQQVGGGDFTVVVPEKGVKEVAQLAQSFNQLGEQLTDYIAKRDFIRDTFSRYVTQEVVKKLLESKDALKMGGETREVSILMSDLRGFTALSAHMAPEKVIDLLNRYLGKMIEILLDNRAIIDEIVGDGILAFFGAPEPLDDHPVRAVACALQMQAAMEEINALNAVDGLPRLEMGIAVNTGAVVVGNIGSERRAKYSVVGAHVNLTSRIESYALGGQVFIGEGTYQQCRDLIEVGDSVQVEMKGVPGPATLYEVLGLGGPYRLRLKEKMHVLVPLTQPIPIHVYRFEEKIAKGVTDQAWITELCETAAQVSYVGELAQWEDVSLRFLDDQEAEVPGRIYGKVIAQKTGAANLHEANIRFTSVSAEIALIIKEAVAKA